jgi:hypothetical protein
MKPKMSRAKACLQRLQQLNHYVRCKQADDLDIPITDDKLLEQEPWNLHTYDVIIMTG